MNSQSKQTLLRTPQPVPPPTAVQPLVYRQPTSATHTRTVPADPRIAKNVQRNSVVSTQANIVFKTSSATHTRTANETTKKRDDHLLQELRKIRKTYTSLTANDLANRGGSQAGSGGAVPGPTTVNQNGPVWLAQKEPVSTWPPASTLPSWNDTNSYSATTGSVYYTPADADEFAHPASASQLTAPPTKNKLTLSEYRSKTMTNELTSSESKAGLNTASTHTLMDNTAGSAVQLTGGDNNSTPLTGAVSESVLHLPISPREIAYAQLVSERKERYRLEKERELEWLKEERLREEERARYRQEERLREELRWREEERVRYRKEKGRLQDEELLREEARLLEESNRSKEEERHSLAVDDIDPLMRGNLCQSDKPVLKGLSPLPSPIKRPAETSSNVSAKKKTWPKAASEKAPLTEDLLVYVGMKECELCKVTYNHPCHAKAHLMGKNHIKKLKMLGLPIPDYCIDKSKPANILKEQVKSEENLEDEEVPWPDWMLDQMKDDFCYICNTPLSSAIIADSHYYGKKHLKRCNAVYNQGEAGNKSTPFYCDVCHIYCSSLQIMDQHMAGSKHKQTAHWKRATQDRPLVSEVRVREMKMQEAENSASQFIANAAEMNGIGEKK